MAALRSASFRALAAASSAAFFVAASSAALASRPRAAAMRAALSASSAILSALSTAAPGVCTAFATAFACHSCFHGAAVTAVRRPWARVPATRPPLPWPQPTAPRALGFKTRFATWQLAKGFTRFLEVTANGQQFSMNRVNYTYLMPPSVSSFSPTSGPVGGSTTVTAVSYTHLTLPTKA